MRKHQPVPTAWSSTPPTAGPASIPVWMPTEDRATAAGSCSWSTVRGISASRDGRCSDCAAESSAATTKITQICGSGRNALTASRLVKPTCATPVHTRSVRRSMWSASAPPQSPKTMSGTSSAMPTAPTTKFEPVRS